MIHLLFLELKQRSHSLTVSFYKKIPQSTKLSSFLLSSSLITIVSSRIVHGFGCLRLSVGWLQHFFYHFKVFPCSVFSRLFPTIFFLNLTLSSSSFLCDLYSSTAYLQNNGHCSSANFSSFPRLTCLHLVTGAVFLHIFLN